MRLKDLHLLTGDHRAAHAADQFLRLAAEHHTGDDFNPPWTIGLLEHGPSRYTATATLSNAVPGWGGSRKSSKLADFRGISHSCSASMRVSAPPLQGDRSEQGRTHLRVGNAHQDVEGRCHAHR